MKYELTDVTGSRWIVEVPEVKYLVACIRQNSELKVIPFGVRGRAIDEWYLMGDKVVAFREED